MDAMTPMTPEARKLNEGRYETERGQQLDVAARRRALTVLLPPGRVLDQAMLEDITRGAQTWAPFIVVRQRLAEAGARSVGAGLILSAAEVAALEEQLHRAPHDTRLGESHVGPTSTRGASAR